MTTPISFTPQRAFPSFSGRSKTLRRLCVSCVLGAGLLGEANAAPNTTKPSNQATTKNARPPASETVRAQALKNRILITQIAAGITCVGGAGLLFWAGRSRL